MDFLDPLQHVGRRWAYIDEIGAGASAFALADQNQAFVAHMMQHKRDGRRSSRQAVHAKLTVSP